MNRLLPWGKLTVLVEPVYPQGQGDGRLPLELERMLRIHYLQHLVNLSESAVEEALYDLRAMREFVGIDLGREPAPDDTTSCKFSSSVGSAPMEIASGGDTGVGFLF